MFNLKHGFTRFAISLAVAASCGISAALAVVDTQGHPPMRSWLPTGQPKMAVLCIHGLGLHSGSYEDLAQRWIKDGVAVYAIDARGFGQWYKRGEPKLDFDATIKDIGEVSDLIAKEHPGVPLFVMGESMGGALALQAASQYQDKYAGLICSVPARDRFGDLNVDLKLGLKVLTKGFGERFNAGDAVIKYGTIKHGNAATPEENARIEAHRMKWSNDPLGRKQYSVGELLVFSNLVNKNVAAAQLLKSMPVLFLQGGHDSLIRPSGTWDIWAHLQTPYKDKVISEASEHLILENGQFGENDLKFLNDWIKNKALAPKVAVNATSEPLKVDGAESAPSVIKSASNLTYWIELKRNGKTFRCNNKTQFQSGDEIRFHLRAGVDGYAYILMQQGSGGARAMLFPEQRTGTNNAIVGGKDCAIPTMTYLRFDENPGVEKVSLIFSKKPMNIDKVLRDPHTVTAYVSQDRTGAKDLVPTRMQLSWDDTAPVLMPKTEPNAMLASHSSLVKVACADDTVALDIALEHK